MAEEKKKIWTGFGVMVLRDGKLLLGKRHDDPEKASSLMHGEGTRTMPGGKMDYGETFEQLVAREVMEETGMTIDTLNLKVISVTNDIVHDNHFITIWFLCENIQGEPQVMEPDEITRRERFPLDQLPSPLFKPSEKVLKNYLAGTIYKH